MCFSHPCFFSISSLAYPNLLGTKGYVVVYLEKCLFGLQACLREIHASILRKHLHRLEHPGTAALEVESEKEIDDKVEDEHDDEEGSP
jgi:hypothetical protein